MQKSYSQYSQFKQDEITEHKIPLRTLIKNLDTKINLTNPHLSEGLSHSEQKQRLEIYGNNELTHAKRISPLRRYLKFLFSCFNFPLLLFGILCFFLNFADASLLIPNCYLGAVLVGAALFNATLDYVQIQKSEDTMESCNKLIPEFCCLLRDRDILRIPVNELVPGDVILLKSGDKVPADTILFFTDEFKVDNSSLTGETKILEKNSKNDIEYVFDAKNLVFKGTQVVTGDAYGIVIRTGNTTMLGKIIQLTSDEKKTSSKITHEIENFVLSIYAIDLLTVTIFFTLVYCSTKSIDKAFLFSAGLLLAWVPEGLPASISLMLSIAVKSLAKNHILVKDFKGVETLGEITMLITDKAGILTRNQMSVSTVYCNMKMINLSSNINKQVESFKVEEPGLKQLFFNISLCLTAIFDRQDIGINQRKVFGNAAECGLLKFIYRYNADFDQWNYSKVLEFKNNNFDLFIYKLDHENGYFSLFVKGQVKSILELCNRINIEGEIMDITDEHLSQLYDINSQLASNGKKVIAFAQLNLNSTDYPKDYIFDWRSNNYPKLGYTLNGLLALEDPPKHGIREAIGKCRSAGIKMVMVSDDNALCAEAVARKTNLMVMETKQRIALRTNRPLNSIEDHESNSIIINGENIELLTDEQWDSIFLDHEEIIFASTLPSHKLEIIKRAQSLGHIVGMVGDGVNDAPALKKADLSIAMADSGSEVVKQVASIILMNNNFATIVKGIEEGRRTFINLKKCIKFTCTHTFPEVIPQIVPALFPIPAAMTTILTVVIDLGFDLCTSLSFAWDEPDSINELMRLQPRIPVTLDNVNSYRKYQKHRIETEYDIETNENKKITLLNKVKHWFSNLGHIKRLFLRREGEYLIDFELVSWSWLEAGILETVISFLAFFWVFYDQQFYLNDIISAFNSGNFDSSTNVFISSSGIEYTTQQLLDLTSQGQSAFVISVMVMQSFNLFAVKSYLRYPFGKHMFNNYKNFISIVFGFIIAAIIIYVPFLNVVFGSSFRLKLGFIWIPVCGGIILLGYTTLKVFIYKRWGAFKFTKTITELHMHPTTRTVVNQSY